MVRTIQLSAFSGNPLHPDLLALVQSGLAGATVQNVDLAGPQKRAQLIMHGHNVVAGALPGRFDLQIFRDSGAAEPLNLEMDPADILERFREPFLSVAAAIESIRIALVIGSAEQAETKEQAVDVVAGKLRVSVPAGVNELEARANSPIERNGITFNRNISWNVAESVLIVARAQLGTQDFGIQQEQKAIIVGGQVDVNTLPSIKLDPSKLAPIFDDARDVTLPLIGAGLEAFDA